MRMSRVLISLLIVIGFACEFPLRDENFVAIEDDPISSITINLSELGDTIQLVTPLNIQYSIDFPEDVRYEVTVTVGDQTVHTSQQVPDVIEITPFQFADGFHVFNMQVLTS